jgi:hypothetical protein
MKPFNLQEALAGKKVVTRDGRSVTQLVHLDVDESFCKSIVGVVDRRPEMWWNTVPKILDDPQSSHSDLFMAGEKKSGWLVVATGGTVGMADSIDCSSVCLHTDDANASFDRLYGKHRGRVVIQVNWEE